MARLYWETLSRRYENGVDRGVVYWNTGGAGVQWGGLISVDELTDREIKKFYLEGKLYLLHQVYGDYSASVKAFSPPGGTQDYLTGALNMSIAPGVLIQDQVPRKFGFCYRTGAGEGLSGTRSYKLHLIYNLLAVPDQKSYVSEGDSNAPTIRGWTLYAKTEPALDAFRSSSHITLDSSAIDPDLLTIFEDLLYGTESTIPRLPSQTEVQEIATDFYT